MGLAKKRKRRRQPANRARSSGPSPFAAVCSFLLHKSPLSLPDKSILRGQEKSPRSRVLRTTILGSRVGRSGFASPQLSRHAHRSLFHLPPTVEVDLSRGLSIR